MSNDRNSTIESIIKTTFKQSLIIILTIIIFSFILFSFITPKTVANLTNEVGMNRLSLFYLEKAYDSREDDIFLLYNIINKSNELDNHSKTKYYFNEIYNKGDEFYYKFVEEVSNQNIDNNISPINLEFVSNEDRIIKRIYINAILNLQKYDKAYEFIINDFKNNDSVKTLEPGLELNILASVYLNYAINNDKLEILEEFKNNDNDFFDSVNTLYDDLNYFFIENIEDNYHNDLDKKLQYLNSVIRFSEFILNFSTVEGFENKFDYSYISENYLKYLGSRSDIIEIIKS